MKREKKNSVKNMKFFIRRIRFMSWINNMWEQPIRVNFQLIGVSFLMFACFICYSLFIKSISEKKRRYILACQVKGKIKSIGQNLLPEYGRIIFIYLMGFNSQELIVSLKCFNFRLSSVGIFSCKIFFFFRFNIIFVFIFILRYFSLSYQ